MATPYIYIYISYNEHTNLNRSNQLEKPIQSIPSLPNGIQCWKKAEKGAENDESIYYTGWKSELNLKHNEDALTSASKGSNFSPFPSPPLFF